MDWQVLHAVNEAVAVRDWLEDPVTLLAAGAVPLYAAAAVALWLLDRPYAELRWKLACASALAAASVAMVANQVVSHVWERPRPYAAHPGAEHLLSAPSADPSFPSDHAAAAFAIAFAVLAFSRRGGAVFLGAATLIGLSRLALGMHYPSDVLAGAVVGWCAAMLVTRPGQALITRLVGLAGRVTDPVLAPVWARALRPARRGR